MFMTTQQQTTPTKPGESIAPGSIQGWTRPSPYDGGNGQMGGMGNFFGSLFVGLAAAADDAPPWSYYPMYRDAFLRSFWKTEPIMAGAVYSMSARLKALEYDFDGGRNQKAYWQKIAQTCQGGKGIGELSFKTMVDLNTQDNGAFWEIVGAGDPNGPRVGPATDVLHMDAARCWRTFDPNYPVIYHNPIDASWHRMHRSRVVTMSSMPQPDELARGIGFCAISRALAVARTMKAMHRYKYEKVTGTQPAILYGNGFNKEELGLATQIAEGTAAGKGLIMWHGIPIIINPDADAKVSMDLLSIKGLPDGYDALDDTTLYVYTLALAFGTDAREIWPATSSGATKADASIQHLKSQGKGIADDIETLQQGWRQILPDGVTLEYDFTDDEQDLQKAQIDQTRSAVYMSMKTGGVMNAEQVRLHAVKDGILDPALMEQAKDWVDPNAPVLGQPTIGSDGKPLPPPPPQAGGQGSQPPGKTSSANMGAAAPSDEVALMSKKDFDVTREKLVDDLTDLIQGGIDDDITKRKMNAGMRSTLNRLGLRALNDGLEVGGVNQESLSKEQLDVFKAWKARTSGYVTDFGNKLYDSDGNLIDARARAELWANKSLKEIYFEGVKLAAPTTLWRWKYGDTHDHCDSCKENEGQVKTMDEWAASGLPQSSDLDCGGWRCDCDLIPEAAA